MAYTLPVPGSAVVYRPYVPVFLHARAVYASAESNINTAASSLLRSGNATILETNVCDQEDQLARLSAFPDQLTPMSDIDLQRCAPETAGRASVPQHAPHAHQRHDEAR
eukprot:438742-Rhodomonas_salina.1